jgi:hypothetical protein
MVSKEKKIAKKSATNTEESKKGPRNFPRHTLAASLVLAQKIQDEMGGNPMNRLLLADALGISPSSTNYRDLLSSAYKYGLTEGTEKADNISLTTLGVAATQSNDQTSRLRALRGAVLKPQVFGNFFRDYANKKVPSTEMLPKILRSQYQVPAEHVAECAAEIVENGRFVDIVRDIGGSAHVLLDVDGVGSPNSSDDEDTGETSDTTTVSTPDRGAAGQNDPSSMTGGTERASHLKEGASPKPIFVGHGKNKAPLQQLQKLLSAFQIPHKVVIDEPNLGRPIPQKVRDAISECGSAILIFTRDEKLVDQDGKEVWRPSENVIHELGATSFVYGDRIVIFKEKGLNFPTNFQSIGYIEFDSEDIQARTADLLKELIGFGLVKVTPT